MKGSADIKDVYNWWFTSYVTSPNNYYTMISSNVWHPILMSSFVEDRWVEGCNTEGIASKMLIIYLSS